MPVYRAYTQPDNPAVYRVIGLDAPEEDVKYSRELKTACLLAAGPQPKPGPVCPRCHEIATFDSRICYKYGLAGAWNMLCHKCRKVHIPTQEGPTENDLEGIERIRDRDRQAHRVRKDAKAARSRVPKKTAQKKKPRERPGKGGQASEQDRATKRLRTEDGVATVRKASDSSALEKPRPFGTISNAMDLEAQKKSNHPREDVHAAPPVIELTSLQAQDRRKRGSNGVEVFHPEDRTVVLVVWEKSGQHPFIDRIAIPSPDPLFLFHNERVRAMPPPTRFERYVFHDNLWSEVPWDISPIEVEPEDDIIFVRVMGIHCAGFGQQLHDYQLDRGHALPLQHRLAHIIYTPPDRHRWFLVWAKDKAPPQIFLINCALFDDVRTQSRVPRPWMDLLRDAPFFLIWHEIQT